MPQLGAGRLRPHGTTSSSASPIAPWQSSGGYDNVAKAIVGDWQLNGVVRGVQRHAVHGHGERHVAEHAEQPADRRPDRRRSTDRQDRRRPARGSTRPRSRSRPASGSATRGRNQFYGPGGWNLDFSVFRTFPMGGTSAARSPVPGGQHPEPRGLRQPAGGSSPPARSDRSPASAATVRIRNGRSSVGLRFQF